jgi:hypothetical protein
MWFHSGSTRLHPGLPVCLQEKFVMGSASILRSMRLPFMRWVLPLLPAFAVPAWGVDAAAPPAQRSALNDTGQSQCVNTDRQFTQDCAGTGQDGEFGRDATATGRGKADRDGHVGFSFVKIGAQGQALPRRATEWACVRDRVTGLVWENKTHDGGLHDMNARFTNLGNGAAGDASAFVAAVNAAGWCGASDWRLPVRRELEGLVDYSVAEGGPMLDTVWFPDSASELHWTATDAEVNAGGPGYRWASNFYDGSSIWYSGEFGRFAVRLVRATPELSGKRWGLRGAEVLDKSTRLVWRRCAEGQAWDGATCAGSPGVFLTWHLAIEQAQAQVQATGLAWRVPNVKELSSLVDTRVNLPTIDTAAFPGFRNGIFHTATPWTENPVYSWRVNFANGEVMRDFWGGSLLLVRDAD